MASLKSSPAWKALDAHRRKMAKKHMRDLFHEDPERFERFSLGLDGFLLDYSKNRITAETLELLCDLARDADVEGWRRRMFSGEAINTTEGRAVLHVALRDPGDGPAAGGEDVRSAVADVRQRMGAFAEDVRNGDKTGATNKPFEAVVNIGIGGSHLGPAMVVDALRSYGKPGLSVRFVSNIDGALITGTLEGLDPETTLFIVASKTFTTEETLTNARTARAWLTDALGDDAVARHFVAVTANAQAAAGFGIEPAATFEFWDWVGGRYSVWSAVGLPVAIAIGMDRFRDLLAGAHEMDRHFLDAPLDANMPVILALIGIWNIDFLGSQALAVLPYDEGLRGLVAYIRQLDMESNGKCVDRDGRPVEAGTGPVIFGEPGTGGQHAFYQSLHQGTRVIPCDFIAAAESHAPTGDHHEKLLANFLAQSEALMNGRTEEEARAGLEAEGADGDDLERLLAHRVFAGNRPTNTILLERVDPLGLGRLLALYEHKVFVQGVIWRINSFDQWGVELGKELASAIVGDLTDAAPAEGHCSSTNGLIKRLKAMKAGRR